MDEVDYDIDGVPVFVSSEAFSDAVFCTDFPDSTVALPPDLDSDVNLISLYLWGPFLNGIHDERIPEVSLG